MHMQLVEAAEVRDIKTDTVAVPHETLGHTLVKSRLAKV
jgi:hypothetical protein